jgi:hypothetical protein
MGMYVPLDPEEDERTWLGARESEGCSWGAVVPGGSLSERKSGSSSEDADSDQVDDRKLMASILFVYNNRFNEKRENYKERKDKENYSHTRKKKK